MQELALATADGHRFPLRVSQPPGALAGLFWLPALGVPAAKYARFAEALAARGVALSVLEWRGIGGSSLRARRGVDWGYAELLRQDIPAAIGALDPSLRWAIGGHSLGGQFAAMAAARSPSAFSGLVLCATGVPDARTFTGYRRVGIRAFAAVLPALTRLVGHYPGEALGFAGREAGGVMRDWAATVRSGRYPDYVGEGAMDEALARLALPALALQFAHDWFVPEASLRGLLAKLGAAGPHIERFDHARLGARADHFKWMRAPDAPAEAIAGWLLSP